MPRRLSIKQLHAATGQQVRAAAKSATPTLITDRGRPVAVLTALDHLPTPTRQPRQILPEYAALMRESTDCSLSEDLDAVRGDR